MIPLAALVLLSSYDAPAAADRCAPLIVRDGRVWTEIVLAGEPVEALLDSGAEMTIVDAGFAAGTGMALAGSAEARGTGEGTIEARFAEGLRIEAAGLTVEDATVAVIDLSDVAERLIGGPLPVILGREVFDAGRLRIDFDDGRICATDDDHQPAGVRLDLETRAGIETVPVAIEGREVRADFDLGNRGALLLSRAFAEEAGLYDGREVRAETGGGIGGAVEREVLIVDRIDLAGVALTDLEASIAGDEDSPANIGLGVLFGFDIVADFGERAVWLAPASMSAD